VIGSHISLLPGDSPVDQARKHALVLRFHAARKDSAAFCRAAQTLVRVPEAHRDDPVVLTAFKTLALGLYEYERTDAVMNGSIKATYAPHAAAARHYGIAYLSLAPHDQEFADWLGMEVCMNIFLQTSNPHYLIEAVSLAHPSADQLMALQNATGVLLGSASQRAVFGKDDEILVSSVFSSPHWDSLLSLTKLRDEELSILTEVRSAALRPTDWHELSGDAAQGAALVGGAVVLGKLNRDTFPNWMLHNVPGKQPAVLHHQWLSKHLFGNRYAQLHRLFDSIGKGTGYYHRILGGHDLGWLLRNLRSLANTEIAGVGKVGYRRAVLVWLQHMSQDLFSPKGIPTPIITRATYLTSRAYAKYVLGLGTKKARTYALRAASKTCLTFVKLAKGANIALWVWAANDVYNMVRDFQADAELRSAGKEIQQAMDYGDMELACEKLRGMLAKRNVSVRKPARTLAMRITLARMYDMAGKKDSQSRREPLWLALLRKKLCRTRSLCSKAHSRLFPGRFTSIRGRVAPRVEGTPFLLGNPMGNSSAGRVTNCTKQLTQHAFAVVFPQGEWTACLHGGYSQPDGQHGVQQALTQRCQSPCTRAARPPDDLAGAFHNYSHFRVSSRHSRASTCVSHAPDKIGSRCACLDRKRQKQIHCAFRQPGSHDRPDRPFGECKGTDCTRSRSVQGRYVANESQVPPRCDRRIQKDIRRDRCPDRDVYRLSMDEVMRSPVQVAEKQSLYVLSPFACVIDHIDPLAQPGYRLAHIRAVGPFELSKICFKKVLYSAVQHLAIGLDPKVTVGPLQSHHLLVTPVLADLGEQEQRQHCHEPKRETNCRPTEPGMSGKSTEHEPCGFQPDEQKQGCHGKKED